MRILDPIYGPVDTNLPSALALLDSPAMKRLEHIDQGGYSRAWFPGKAFTRLEHSLGVFLLLARYGASEAECLSGLIHDASHSAFSHCIDYVLDAGSETCQSLQDDVFGEVVGGTDIPALLNAYGFDAAYVMDEANFPLLERDLPGLCADRIDYALRTAFHFGVLPAGELSRILDGLKVLDGVWVFTGPDLAMEFAELFSLMNQKFFSGLDSAGMFRSVGDCLRHCLSRGYITKGDLYVTDDHVLGKVRARVADDPELARLWARMNRRGRVVDDAGRHHAVVRCKSRVVDPLCLSGGRTVPLSRVRPAWSERVAREMEPRVHYLRFIDQPE